MIAPGTRLQITIIPGSMLYYLVKEVVYTVFDFMLQSGDSVGSTEPS